MIVARRHLLTACGVILLAVVVGGCDSMGLPTPVTPISATAPTFATAGAGAISTPLTPIPAPTDIPTPNIFPTAVLGPGTFSGTYLYDGRPNFIYFLSVTQTNNEVAGYLNNVRPDGRGGTQATTIPLNGTIDSNVVTLYASSTGRVYTLSRTTGEDGGSRITFSFPTSSGGIAAEEVTPASQSDFNNLLSGWQASLSDEKQITQDILAKSKKLGDWINYLNELTRSFNRAIPSIEEILDRSKNFSTNYTEALDIQGMRAELSTLKEKAAVRPMSCFDYDSVDYYYESEKYNYDGLTKRRSEFAKEVSSLETSLSQVDAYVSETQDAAQVLEEAIQNSDYPLPAGARGPWPGDELTPISNYQAAADAAHNQLPALKATDAANQTIAASLMAEGKSVLDGAKALVNCPP